MSRTITRFDVPSPLGTLRCAATPRGLAWIALPGSDLDGPPTGIAAGARVQHGTHPAAEQLREWFDGGRREFDVPLDLGRVSGFRRDVLEALREVPWGALVTYGELARAAGRLGAARAVGGAMNANPLPLVVP